MPDTRRCKTCMLLKRGDCNVPKEKICEFYKPSASISVKERETWPKYGDVSSKYAVSSLSSLYDLKE